MNVSLTSLREQLGHGLRVVLEPVAALLERLHATPNQITILGCLLGFASALLLAGGHPAWAGVLFLVAGSFDLIDGALARSGHMESRFGALLDSTCDRLSEGAVFAAAAFVFAEQGAPWLVVATFAAAILSFLVSYVRARTEGLGGTCSVGLAVRPERVVLLAAGMLLDLLAVAICALVILSAITVAQRLAHAFRVANGDATGPRELPD